MDDKTLVERQMVAGDIHAGTYADLNRQIEALQSRNEALEAALRPFASLIGEGVNMNDPLSKWVTLAQIADAHDALESKS